MLLVKEAAFTHVCKSHAGKVVELAPNTSCWKYACSQSITNSGQVQNTDMFIPKRTPCTNLGIQLFLGHFAF